MSIPTDNNPRTFNQKLLDSVTYLHPRGSSLCLIGKTDNLDDLNNVKRYHVKEPVYFAPVSGDGNCAMRAVLLSFLMQGILCNKQYFTAEKLGQIFNKNKDKLKEFYGIEPPKYFPRFIEAYCALTPDKCAVFFRDFFSELDNNEIFEFLITCLRLDIFIFCKNNFTDELVNKFDTTEFFEENLNELPVIGSHVDAEFLRFYLQYSHQISIDVYEIYQGHKESDAWFSSEDNNPRQEQRSQNLHLNIVFYNNHFDTVIFKKDIDRYLEQNKEKCLEKQFGCSLGESLLNGSSVINKKETKISSAQDQAPRQEKKNIMDQFSPDSFELRKCSQERQETSLKKLEKNASEALKIRFGECSQPSNDPVINKKETQVSTPHNRARMQEKKDFVDLSSPDSSTSIKYSQESRETLPKTLEKNQNKSLRKRLKRLEEYLLSQDSVINEKSTRSALKYLIKDLKSELKSQSLLGALDYPAQKLLVQAQLILNNSDESEELLREDSKKLTEILIQHQEEKLNFYFAQKKLLKRLDIIEKYLSDVNAPTSFSSLKKCLKNEQVGQSWQGSLDSLDRTLLNQAKFILMRSDKSEKQLREDAEELIKIYKAYQKEKLKYSPGLLSNKKNDCRRQQAHQKGSDTDLFTNPKLLK